MKTSSLIKAYFGFSAYKSLKRIEKAAVKDDSKAYSRARQGSMSRLNALLGGCFFGLCVSALVYGLAPIWIVLIAAAAFIVIAAVKYVTKRKKLLSLLLSDARLKGGKLFHKMIETPVVISQNGYIGFIDKSSGVKIFHIKDVNSFKLVVDQREAVNISGAAVGGVFFGGVGAILGGMKGREKITSMNILFGTKDFYNPTVSIRLLSTGTNKGSFVYNSLESEISDLMATLEIVEKSAVEKPAVNDVGWEEIKGILGVINSAEELTDEKIEEMVRYLGGRKLNANQEQIIFSAIRKKSAEKEVKKHLDRIGEEAKECIEDMIRNIETFNECKIIHGWPFNCAAFSAPQPLVALLASRSPMEGGPEVRFPSVYNITDIKSVKYRVEKDKTSGEDFEWYCDFITIDEDSPPISVQLSFRAELNAKKIFDEMAGALKEFKALHAGKPYVDRDKELEYHAPA